MKKYFERARPDSCWNKAKEDETVFCLLGRDKAAPAAIRYWCMERIRMGLNKPEDSQMIYAIACARNMEIENAKN